MSQEREQLPRGMQTKLAERTGIASQTVNAILTGRRPATIENARLLEAASTALGVPISRLSWLYPDEYPCPYIAVK